VREVRVVTAYASESRAHWIRMRRLTLHLCNTRTTTARMIERATSDVAADLREESHGSHERFQRQTAGQWRTARPRTAGAIRDAQLSCAHRGPDATDAPGGLVTRAVPRRGKARALEL